MLESEGATVRGHSTPRLGASLVQSLRALPPEAWALALSLDGFFLYLGVLDIADVAPRTWLTGLYFAGLGAVLLGLAARNREVLRRRFAARDAAVFLYAIAACALAIWFLINVAVLTEGSLPRKLAALLLFSTLPTALLFASLPARWVENVARAMVGLGVVFVAAETLALLRIAGDEVKRFSPVAALDAINAAQIPALAAVACLALTPGDRRGRVLQGGAIALLSAGAVLPGSRGPLVALVVASATALVVAGRPLLRVALPGLAIGLTAGFLLASAVGTSYYLTYSTPGFGPQGGPGGPISSFSIRRQWWESAVEAFPDRPIFGHGVAMFVDDTPEAHRMGVAGKRTYLHNSLVEAGYSLGVLGLVPFLALVLVPIWALVRLRAAFARPRAAVVLVSGLYAFAIVFSSLSGEIGADLLLWSAGALAVGLYAESRRRETASER